MNKINWLVRNRDMISLLVARYGHFLTRAVGSAGECRNVKNIENLCAYIIPVA